MQSKKLKKHKDADDKEELESAAKALNDTIMPIGAKMYEAASKDESAEADESTEKKDDEPVEGEVVDEKKDKKKK